MRKKYGLQYHLQQMRFLKGLNEDSSIDKSSNAHSQHLVKCFIEVEIALHKIKITKILNLFVCLCQQNFFWRPASFSDMD